MEDQNAICRYHSHYVGVENGIFVGKYVPDVDLVDVDMASTRMPTQEELLDLLDTFDTVGTPVLIHCWAGANRTSIACFLWLLYREEMTKAEAVQMISMRYGHLPIGDGAWVDKFCSMVPDIRPERLRDWIVKEYKPE